MAIFELTLLSITIGAGGAVAGIGCLSGSVAAFKKGMRKLGFSTAVIGAIISLMDLAWWGISLYIMFS